LENYLLDKREQPPFEEKTEWRSEFTLD